MIGTTVENFVRLTESLGFHCGKAGDGDYDIRPRGSDEKQGSAVNLIQLIVLLQANSFKLSFYKDNSIHVHAPHRKVHDWGDRGWDCSWGVSVELCETLREVQLLAVGSN